MSELDHNGQQKEFNAEIYVRSQGTIWSCVKRITTHHFFLFVLLLVCCAIMFIFFYVNQNYFGLDLPTPGYQRIRFPIPIPIHTHMRHLYYVRIGCCNGAMLTPGFFHFFSIVLSKEHRACCVKSRIAVRAELRFEFYRSRCLGSQSALVCFLCATDSLQGCPVCMHLVV